MIELRTTGTFALVQTGPDEYELRFPTVHVIVKVPIADPSAPALGAVTAVSTTGLDIALAAPGGGRIGLAEYQLERRVYQSGSFAQIATGGTIFEPNLSYRDSGLTAGTQYEYRARIVDASGRISEWSAPATGTTGAASTINPPENVAAESISGGIRLTWSAPSSGLAPDAYEIQRTYAVDGVWSVKTTQAGTTYDDTNVAAGEAKWYRIVAINGSNRSAESAVVVGVGGGTAQAGARKWHPSHGIKVSDDYGGTGDIAKQQNEMNDLTDSALLKFAHVRMRWGRLNTTGSTYNWSALDSHLAHLQTLGKKLILQVQTKSFGTGAYTLLAPSDILAANTVAAKNGWTVALWRPAVMDRYIATMEQIAARYDDDVRLEGITWAESSPSIVVSENPDYSVAGFAAQLKRLYAAAGTAFVHTTPFANMNSLSGGSPATSQISGLLESAYQAGIGFGAPDIKDEAGNVSFTGATPSNYAPPVRDYRGLMANSNVMSVLSMEEFANCGAVIDWAQSHSVTHLGWIQYGTGSFSWANVLSAIAADPNLHTACPTNHAGGCDTT